MFESVMKEKTSPSYYFDNIASAAITSQVHELVTMGVIKKCSHSAGENLTRCSLLIANVKQTQENQCV